LNVIQTAASYVDKQKIPALPTPPQEESHILENTNNKKAAVAPSADVYPKCQTYPDIDKFQFKFTKKVVGFPSSNVPVLCHSCPVQHFMWSYNIEKHYDTFHSGLSAEHREKYVDHFATDEEKQQVVQSFPIIIN